MVHFQDLQQSKYCNMSPNWNHLIIFNVLSHSFRLNTKYIFFIL